MPQGYWEGRAANWTEAQLDTLRKAYAGEIVYIDALAASLGKLKSNVSRKARELGLTRRGRKQPESAKAAISERSRKYIAENGHPRGMLGKHHTPEARARMVVAQQKVNAEGRRRKGPVTEETRRKMSMMMQERLRSTSSVYSRTKSGRREDLGGQFFRSRWEANYARFLNMLLARGDIADWKYEPDTFWFEKIRRGVRSYMPDFKVWRLDGTIYYVEVKGWMDPKSATKIKRMAKYHPKVELQVFGAKAYRELAKKLAGAIPNWEHDK